MLYLVRLEAANVRRIWCQPDAPTPSLVGDITGCRETCYDIMGIAQAQAANVAPFEDGVCSHRNQESRKTFAFPDCIPYLQVLRSALQCYPIIEPMSPDCHIKYE